MHSSLPSHDSESEWSQVVKRELPRKTRLICGLVELLSPARGSFAESRT
jgi:hypothetical protein